MPGDPFADLGFQPEDDEDEFEAMGFEPEPLPKPEVTVTELPAEPSLLDRAETFTARAANAAALNQLPAATGYAHAGADWLQAQLGPGMISNAIQGLQGWSLGDEQAATMEGQGHDVYEDERRRYFDELQRQAPTEAAVGDVFGTVAGAAAVPGVPLARGAGFLANAGRVGANALLDAGMAGVAEYGRTEDLDAAGKAAVAGGLTSGVIGGGLAATGGMVRALAKGAEGASEGHLAAAGGMRSARMRRKVEGMPGGIPRFAKDLKELGIGTGEASTGARSRIPQPIETFADDAVVIGQQAAETRRALADEFGGGRIDTDGILKELEDQAKKYTKLLQGDRASKYESAASELREVLKTEGQITAGDAWEIIRALDKRTNFAVPVSEVEIVGREAGKDIRRTFKQALEKHIGDTLGPEQLKEWRDAGRRYQVAARVQQGATEIGGRELTNRMVSLTDYLAAIGMGGAGAELMGAAGGGVLGIAGVVANRALRGRERAAAAMVTEGIAERGGRLADRLTGAAPPLGRLGALGVGEAMSTPAPIPDYDVSLGDAEIGRLGNVEPTTRPPGTPPYEPPHPDTVYLPEMRIEARAQPRSETEARIRELQKQTKRPISVYSEGLDDEDEDEVDYARRIQQRLMEDAGARQRYMGGGY